MVERLSSKILSGVAAVIANTTLDHFLVSFRCCGHFSSKFTLYLVFITSVFFLKLLIYKHINICAISSL